MTHTNPGLTDDHDNPADRIVTPGSVWRSHRGYTCRVAVLGVMVPSTEPGVMVQEMGLGNVFFFAVRDFLGEVPGQSGVLRFTRVEE